jgi:NAD(P)-dependent dehydrogenase (short-subunit alcohol dehydrogenase family)
MSSIFITGVTKGIGNALAKKFSDSGHKVSGFGRDKKKLEELSEITGGKNIFINCDIRSYKNVKDAADIIIEKTGIPEIIINNAGVINKNQNLWETDPDEFENVISTNINGSFHIIKYFTPLFIQRKKGIIVNMSSGWGRSAAPGVSAYCASKWAVEGLTKSLAMELPAGTAAVTLNPGVINTDMLKSCFGNSALLCQSPEEFALKAEKLILSITEKDNGKELSV